MATLKPQLVWVDTKKDDEGYIHPNLNKLLAIPGNTRYIGRELQRVRGNILRGRKSTPDTLNIWFIDDFAVNNLRTNQALHGTALTLVGDPWGETICEGPVVAVLKAGRELDPHSFIDITMTAYRDAIDYLGYFRQGQGSMIDGPGAGSYLSKVVMKGRVR